MKPLQASAISTTALSTWTQRLLLLIIGSLWITLLIAFQEPNGLGIDFYPLHYAAQLLIERKSPYSADATAYLVQVWHVSFAHAGIAYPLPAVLAFLPVLLLPLSIGILVWSVGGAVGSWFAIRLRDDWAKLLLLPCCFMPLHRAIVVKQATLIWFACIVLLVLAMRDRRAWLVGWCIAVLPAKPQTGLFFAIAAIIWAVVEDRRALLWAAVWVSILWGGSFALQPHWLTEWLASLSRYNQIVPTASLLPWGLILIPFLWRLPWYAQLSIAQVIVFPLSDIYSALPLLLVWVAIGGPLALVGSAVSWLWIFLHLPNTVTYFWLFLLVPLMLARAWRLYQSWPHKRAASAQTKL